MGPGHLRNGLLIGAAALALAACGGGSGGIASAGSVPAVTPAPPPSPPPPVSTPVTILPNVTSSTEFTTPGIASNGRQPATLTTTGFSVSYDAPTSSYMMQLGGLTPGSLRDFGVLRDSTGQYVADVRIFKPVFSYSALIGYDTRSEFPNVTDPFGFAAFGKATQAGSTPTVGSATYNAIISGSTADRYNVSGSAILQFDFSAGKLSGHLDPILTDPTGLGFNDTAFARYDFANTVYSSGNTTFSGQLTTPGLSPGAFNGLFTGPGAEELIGRWNAPAINPITNQNTQIFGAMIGKRP